MSAVRRTRQRRLGAIASLTLLAALASACGDETTTDADEASDPTETSSASETLQPRTAAASPLGDKEAHLALLTKANLGAAFEGDAVVEEPVPDDGKTGCESEVPLDDRLDKQGVAASNAEIEYLMFDETRILVVSSHVTSFDDESTAEDAFAGLVEDLGDCTHLEDTDDMGTTSVDFVNDDSTATGDVDEQFNMVGTGSALWGEEQIPLAASFSAARVGNNATMVFLVGFGAAEDSKLIGPYTEIAVNRLVAVASGQTPDDVAAPLPQAPGIRLPDGLSESLQDMGDQLAPDALLGGELSGN